MLEGVTNDPPVITIDGTLGTEVYTDTEVAENMYFVNYDTGEVTFHSDNAGEDISVDYYGLGSLIVADHINELRDRLVAGLAEPEDTDIGYEVGSVWTYDQRVWVCVKSTSPAIWMEWGGTKLYRRDNEAGTETSIEINEDCGITVYINKPINTLTPEIGRAHV